MQNFDNRLDLNTSSGPFNVNFTDQTKEKSDTSGQGSKVSTLAVNGREYSDIAPNGVGAKRATQIYSKIKLNKELQNGSSISLSSRTRKPLPEPPQRNGGVVRSPQGPRRRRKPLPSPPQRSSGIDDVKGGVGDSQNEEKKVTESSRLAEDTRFVTKGTEPDDLTAERVDTLVNSPQPNVKESNLRTDIDTAKGRKKSGSLSKKISKSFKKISKKLSSPKFTNSIDFEAGIASNNGRKGLNLNDDQLEKFPNEIHSIVKMHRKRWKKGKQDDLRSFDTSLGKTGIQYIASKDQVIVRLGEIGNGTFKTASLAMDYKTGKLYASTWEQTSYDSVEQLLEDDTSYLSSFAAGGLLGDSVPANVLVPRHLFMQEGAPQNQLYQLYELCEGGELCDYDGKTLSQSEKINITHDLINGLKELHQAGVVHGDLSSRNMMLKQEGKVAVLMDFDKSNQLIGGEKYRGNMMKGEVSQLGAAIYQVFYGVPAEIEVTVQTRADDYEEGKAQDAEEVNQRESALLMPENYDKIPEPETSLEKLLVKMMSPRGKNGQEDQRMTADEALEKLQSIMIQENLEAAKSQSSVFV